MRPRLCESFEQKEWNKECDKAAVEARYDEVGERQRESFGRPPQLLQRLVGFFGKGPFLRMLTLSSVLANINISEVSLKVFQHDIVVVFRREGKEGKDHQRMLLR